MSYVKQYLRFRIRHLLMCAVFASIYFLTFSLYGLPVEAVIYPTILCSGFGLVYMGAGFYKYRKHHEQLQYMKHLSAELMDSMPDSIECCEEDYRQIVESLRTQLKETTAANTSRYADMMDYYTIWVHQIKTPIASMQITLQNDDTPVARKALSDLKKIEQYVNMVLTYIRLDSNDTDYVFKSYDLDEIVRSCVRKFAGDFIGKKLKLEYSELNTGIVTDEKWFSFVVEQLLSNAIKYTDKGSVRIYMSQSNVLSIQDTGIGISSEDLPRIFEKGYTGFNGHIDKKASGIGLYLCKRICNNLGYTITVESKPGIGTKTDIHLHSQTQM